MYSCHLNTSVFFFCIFCIYSTNIYKVLTELQGFGLAFGFNEMCINCSNYRFLCTLFFYWHVIISQCCIGFWCTMKWISSMYTYIPSLLIPPPSPIPSLQVITEHWDELPVLHSSFPLAVCFTRGVHNLNWLLIAKLFPNIICSNFYHH